MLVPELRERVYKANMELPEHGLVKFTWGNVSAIDREKGLIAIKPSGVAYEKLSPENMVVTDLDGNIVEGDLNCRRMWNCTKHFQKWVALFIRIRQKEWLGRKQGVIFLVMAPRTLILSTVQFHALVP